MLPSPPEASRNKQEYFPDSTRTPSLPASFPWRWYDFLQAAQIVLSEYANSPRAWFAAAQPGTQAVFLPINTCLIDSSFPYVPKKKPNNSSGPPNLSFAVPGARGSSGSRSPFHATNPSVSPYAAFSPRPAFLPSLSASSQTGSGSRQPCGLFAQRRR